MRGPIRSRAGGCLSSDTISATRRVDPAVRALFVEARRDAWASNLGLLDAARPALESLAAAGIRTMLLKGAVLASPPYFEPGLRPIGDVDVLVEPVHARAAMRILEESGWVAWRRHSERDLLLAHGLDLRKPPHGALDVHWYLLAECCWEGADRGLWQRAQPMTSVTFDDGRSGAGGPAVSHLRTRSAVESRAFRTLGRRRRSHHSDRRRAARLGCRRERSGAATARPADDARPACGSRARARRCSAGGDRNAGAAADILARSARVPLQGPARSERGRPVRDLDRVASKRRRSAGRSAAAAAVVALSGSDAWSRDPGSARRDGSPSTPGRGREPSSIVRQRAGPRRGRGCSRASEPIGPASYHEIVTRPSLALTPG